MVYPDDGGPVDAVRDGSRLAGSPLA